MIFFIFNETANIRTVYLLGEHLLIWHKSKSLAKIARILDYDLKDVFRKIVNKKKPKDQIFFIDFGNLAVYSAQIHDFAPPSHDGFAFSLFGK